MFRSARFFRPLAAFFRTTPPTTAPRSLHNTLPAPIAPSTTISSKSATAALAVASIAILTEYSLSQQNQRCRKEHLAKETYIVTIGSLLSINYSASIRAFMRLAEKEGKKWNFDDVARTAILREDEKFKNGELSETEFRSRINTIIGIHPTDAEFDTAWNAMLGDTSQASSELAALRAFPVQVIFVSNTNPIHARKLGMDSSKNTILSYQHHCTGIELYKKAVAVSKLSSSETTLLWKTSDHSASNLRQGPAVTEAVPAWAGGIMQVQRYTSEPISGVLSRCIEDHKQEIRGHISPYVRH